MNTTKLLITTFLFFAFNVNISATDISDNFRNSIEINKNNTAPILIKNGRNKSLKNIQSDITIHLAVFSNNVTEFKAIQPRTQTLQALDRKKEKSSSYPMNGRNKRTMNEMISMK